MPLNNEIALILAGLIDSANMALEAEAYDCADNFDGYVWEAAEGVDHERFEELYSIGGDMTVDEIVEFVGMVDLKPGLHTLVYIVQGKKLLESNE